MRRPAWASSTSAFIACGAWLIGLGLYFMFLRPPLLPEDFRYIGTSPADIQSVMPGLAPWLRHVFTVLGGFMTGSGLLTILVATNVAVIRGTWTWFILASTGLVTVGTMSLTNFELDSDFRWLLLAPPLMWIIGLVIRPVVRTKDV